VRAPLLILGPLLVIAVVALASFLMKPHARFEEVPAKEAAFLRRLRLLGILILAGGLPAAALTYMRTSPGPGTGAIGYVVEGGVSYPITPETSKRYNYEMESMEGKEGVLFAESLDWFESLWHGRRLATTLAVLSLSGSAACFLLFRLLLVFHPLPSEPAKPDGSRGG